MACFRVLRGICLLNVLEQSRMRSARKLKNELTYGLLFRMYPMLYALRLSTTPTQSLLCYAIFSQTGPLRGIHC